MFYGFDHAVYHYALQLGLNETVGAARLQASLLERERQSQQTLKPHDTWNLNLELSPQRLQQTLETIIAVDGQRERYLGQREVAGAVTRQPSGPARRRQQAGRGDARAAGGGRQSNGHGTHARVDGRW